MSWKIPSDSDLGRFVVIFGKIIAVRFSEKIDELLETPDATITRRDFADWLLGLQVEFQDDLRKEGLEWMLNHPELN